jgi:hypothetical protein
LDLPAPVENAKSGDFPHFRDWPGTCNIPCHRDIERIRPGRIQLIPRIVKHQFHLACPFLWGRRRIDVSFVWTIHGGSCCYCGYPASRSLCCFSLVTNSFFTVQLVPSPPRSVSGRIEAEVRLAPDLFRLRICRVRTGVPLPLPLGLSWA